MRITRNLRGAGGQWTARLWAASLALCALPIATSAQTERLGQLVNGRQFVVSADKQPSRYYLVTSAQTRMMHRKDGKLIVGGDTLDPAVVKMRLKSMQRFAVDEDSATFAANYSVDHGLLAFRRSMNVGKWNTIVVPFELTGTQLRDAFGDDAQLAGIKGVTEGAVEATLEFQTINLNTDDVVLEAGLYYLLKPTREPDVTADGQTSVIYGSGKVAGPVYAIAGVSLTKGTTMPTTKIYRSESNEVRITPRGTYRSREGSSMVPVKTRSIFAIGDDGQFSKQTDSLAVKAFRYWFEDYSSKGNVKFSFVIDGVADDIGVTTDMSELLPARQTYSEETVYTLQGRRVSNNGPSGLRPGIYIVNGKKVYIK